MIIDFHTHIFPDKMAEATVKMLAEKAGFPNHLDAKASSLIESMDKSGIDRSVILPALTAPRQFDSVNRFTREIASRSEGRLIPFGGIHPDCEAPEEKIEFLSKNGFYGIKLHPDYQQTFIDDEKYIKVITLAIKNGLAVTIHAGLDVGMPDPVHCPPVRAARMLDRVLSSTIGYDPRIILAHMGGYAMSREVIEYLCSYDVYFDTGFTLFEKDLDNTLEIIRTHGASKILFASDSPWAPQDAYLKAFKRLPLSDADKAMILGLNAERILGL